MRNGLVQENRARNCQEFEDSQRVCCEETDRARQARVDELSLQQQRNPTTVSQLLTQVQDLQNKVNLLADTIEFYDPETASSSGASHVPSQPLIIPSPSGMLSRDSGLPSSALYENSRNLASSNCGLGPGTTGNILEHGRG